MRKILVALSLIAALFATQARADFTAKDAAAATITFKGTGVCTSVVCVPLFTLFDPTGTNGAAVDTAGADAVSNTKNGLAVYSRMIFYNGTTWDRWQGAVNATLAAETTKVIGTVRVASGGIASGALASGAGADGWDSTQGATADAAATDGSTGTVSAKLRRMTTNQASQITQETATATGVGTPTDTPCTAPATQAGSCTMEALLKALLNTGQYPAGATAITASATGTTAATTATLAGAVGKTTYICGYSIRANATAAATVTNTITGVITATLSSIMWVAPLASGIGVDEQIFNPCIPASATNTGIAIVSGAPGSGGTVSSKGWGYQL